jgi:hypothetical protein
MQISPRDARRGCSRERECDDVRRGGIGQKVVVKPGQRLVGHENHGELAGARKDGAGMRKGGVVPIERADSPRDGPAVDAQARVQVCDCDGTLAQIPLLD